MRKNNIAALTFALGLVLIATTAQAQSFVFPEKGQSAEQQQQDEGACHQWAKQQTGIDPVQQMAAAPPPPPQQGGALRGAGRGAAVGAIGGAIGGDAGKGAAVGAGVERQWELIEGGKASYSTSRRCSNSLPSNSRASKHSTEPTAPALGARDTKSDNYPSHRPYPPLCPLP